MVVDNSAYERLASVPSYWDGVVSVREGMAIMADHNTEKQHHQQVADLAQSIKLRLLNGTKLSQIEEYKRYSSIGRYVPVEVIHG